MTQPPVGRTPSPDLDISQWLNIEELCASDGNIESTSQNHPEQPLASQAEISTQPPGNSASTAEQEGQDYSLKPTKSSKGSRRALKNGESFSVTCFPSDPARPEGKKKKRRDFAERRRQEVAQIRKTGACLRCKIRRTSVSLPWDSRAYQYYHVPVTDNCSAVEDRRAMPVSKPRGH